MAIPLYRELLNSIKIQIINGFYKEGDLLPSEHELMDTHQVTRSTVRQALSELVNDDYIIKKQGLGSIVTNPRRRTLGLLSVKGFSEAVSDQKKAVVTIMIHKPHLQAWDENFFYPLSEVEKKAGCIYVRRLRCVEEEPVMLESTYIGNLNLPRFCALPFVNGSLFGTLNLRYHVEITDVEQDLRAVLADEELAKNLQVSEGSPLLHVYLKFHTSREHLFVYGSLLCNTLKYSIGNRL